MKNNNTIRNKTATLNASFGIRANSKIQGNNNSKVNFITKTIQIL